MHACRITLVSAAAAFLLPGPAMADTLKPLQFFEGRTEGLGTIKVLMKKPYSSRSTGRGRLEPNGTLVLVQQVEDEGKPPRERRWQIRQVSAHRFAGTMSEATGPVTIDEVDGRYRFRFRMKGNLSVEQWLSPLPDGRSARNSITIRKLGMKVGSGDGTIRKLGGG